jgi:hypothetical protein
MRRLLVSFIALFVVSGGLAGAQSQATAQDRQAILDYQLTLPRSEHLIAAMAAMTKHLVSLPDFQDRLAKSMKMTSAERRSALEKDPAAMAILKQNELSPQDYLVGVPALRMALPGCARTQLAERHCVAVQCRVCQGESRSAQAQDGCR